jgi:hypothetical protein
VSLICLHFVKSLMSYDLLQNPKWLMSETSKHLSSCATHQRVRILILKLFLKFSFKSVEP